ncbi:hypothetical protein ACIQMJ_21975 [Actinosynnema sp. NPDC091369]
MVVRRLVIAALWLVALVLALVFRDRAPGALSAVVAGGAAILLVGPVMRAVDRRKRRTPGE